MAMYPAIARRLLEDPINNGNLAAVDQIVPSDANVHILFHQPVVDGGVDPSTLAGPELLKAGIALQPRLFPDLHVEIDQFLNFGHTLIAFCTLSGTARNDRRASWDLVCVMHFHDSKIVEVWMTFDRLGMYQQLGVVPASPELLEQVIAAPVLA